jgi:hypothetical protein
LPNPVAPILETAFGFKADSTTAKYLISKGTFCFANSSSNNGNNILKWPSISQKTFPVFQKDLITFSKL